MSNEISMELKAEFIILDSQMSPENLSCDGELSRSEINYRYKELQKQWKALEKKAGTKVAEDDVWKWYDEVSNWQQKKLDKELSETQYPGLDHDSSGVWNLKGANGFSAYYIQDHKEKYNQPGLIKIDIPENERYVIYSPLHRDLFNEDEIGKFKTIKEAKKAGDDFLKTVNFDLFKKQTQYTDENIKRELEKLPKNLLMQLEDDSFCP